MSVHVSTYCTPTYTPTQMAMYLMKGTLLPKSLCLSECSSLRWFHRYSVCWQKQCAARRTMDGPGE